MAKKINRSQRDTRPRINEAQLQAYRARKAETVAQPDAQPKSPEAVREQPAAAGMVTAWGHVDDEYAMIRADLIRLLVITAAMFAIILVLWFVLA